MNKKTSFFSVLSIVVGFMSGIVSANSDDPVHPTYPRIPSSYEVLNPARLIMLSQVNFPAYLVGKTNGYKVTTPEGNELIVDNIVQPKCAFYASYVTTDDSGFLSLGASTTVISNVYIGEVNFDNCK